MLKRFAGGFFGNSYVAFVSSILISTLAVFVFLFTVYYLLTNEKLTWQDVLPGAIVATIALETSFQLLPLYLRLSKNVIALQAFGAPALLLVWLYLMANVIVFGAEINWWHSRTPPRSGRARRSARARLGRLVPAFFAMGPRDGGAALEDEVVLAARPDADRVAVRVDRDCVALRPRRENSNVLAGASLRFMILCAPSGPAGKRTSSPRSNVCSPSGVRTTTVPSTTSSHSSSYS